MPLAVRGLILPNDSFSGAKGPNRTNLLVLQARGEHCGCMFGWRRRIACPACSTASDQRRHFESMFRNIFFVLRITVLSSLGQRQAQANLCWGCRRTCSLAEEWHTLCAYAAQYVSIILDFNANPRSNDADLNSSMGTAKDSQS